ncbi:MAG: glycosyltransferase [Desulfobulbaceae bacterium]|jgi:glycosyltransferase involved in cell wall biosynthesis|nr:glycosyltransferase [Desulfobulbaceae bacterium]
MIYPGLDLNVFTAFDIKHTGIKPKILFATAPREEHELAERGVYLLLETARACPDIQFTLLFRKWRAGHTSIKKVEDNLALNPVTNITIVNEAVQNMAEMFRRHHFTIIPFTSPTGGKECPNSMVESMACGIPALVSTCAPIADFVDETSSGVCFHPNVPSLLKAIDEGMSRWNSLASNARKTAEQYFSLDTTLNAYAALYDSAIHEGTIVNQRDANARGVL